VMVHKAATGCLDDTTAVRGGVVWLTLAEGYSLGHFGFWVNDKFPAAITKSREPTMIIPAKLVQFESHGCDE